MRLVTLGRAQRETNISRWTWRRAVEKGEVPGLRRGNRWYVDLDAVADQMREQAAARRGE